jgi:RNA-directed DNA polymerase
MPGCPLQRHHALTLADVMTEAVLDTAYAWLCHQRRDWPAEADVWRFRQHWPEGKAQLRADLLADTYEVGLLSRVTLQNGEEVELWTARDAVVMKALALVLPQHLPLSPRCTHLKGHGGLKHAVREVLTALPQHRFVLKTDVRAYYASIDHQLLLDRLAIYISDRQILNIIGQYLQRCAEQGGLVLGPHPRHCVGQSAQPDSRSVFLNRVG